MTGCGFSFGVLAAFAACAGTAMAQSGPPANDLCVNAITLMDGSNENGTLVGASNDGNASCGFSTLSPDVWYAYTPAVSGPVTISTCNAATFDTALSVQAGCGGLEIACQDDGEGCAGFTTVLVAEMTAGERYLIRVTGYDSAVGTFTLSLTGGGGGLPPVPPVNDNCADPMVAELGTTLFTNVDAMTDGPAHALCLSNGETIITNDVWFTHTATATGNLLVTTCGSAFDTYMAVYSGSGCEDLETRLLACNDDALCGESVAAQSSAVVAVVAGQSYTIRVGGFNSASGEGVLELSMQAPQGDRYAVVFAATTSVPGVGAVQNEDIMMYDTATEQWAMLFDGSDVGLSGLAIGGLAVTTEGDFLLSFTDATNIPGMTSGPSGTALDNSDIVRFVATSLGGTTAGNFVFHFDGSDVGLTQESEAIDGISMLQDGRLVLSIDGNGAVPGVSSLRGEDLVMFTPTLLGPVTTGAFTLHFDGSDVGLSSNGENVDAVMIAADGHVRFSTSGDFSVSGLAGPNEDVIDFAPTSLGEATAGAFSTLLDLSALGIATGANLSAVEKVTMLPVVVTPNPTCVADFNGDGTVGAMDLLLFLEAFLNGDPTADIDASGTVDFMDLSEFVMSFLSGCGGTPA